MNLVMVAKTRVMTCDFCKDAIAPGEVYVLLYVEDEHGRQKWTNAHLYCDARRRGAQKVRLRALPMAQTKDGMAVRCKEAAGDEQGRNISHVTKTGETTPTGDGDSDQD